MTAKLRVLDLFSGIGGFSLGFDQTGGFETVAFCEREAFPRKVLAKHWPDVPCYDDVRTLTAERLAVDGIAVDVITGGFPCQDISFAGKGAGLAGERSGLFYEVARLIGELEPRFVILENVSALLSRGLDAVLGTMASLGYDAEWHCIPASYLGAPHRRDRIWIIAYPARDGWQGRASSHKNGNAFAPTSIGLWTEPAGDRADDGAGVVADATRARLERRALTGNPGEVGPWVQQFIERRPDSDRRDWGVEPSVGRVVNGVPDRAHRLKALGNAVVPQIPELIGRAILNAIND